MFRDVIEKPCIFRNRQYVYEMYWFQLLKKGFQLSINYAAERFMKINLK
jgi:hypothetical protein